VWFGSTRTPVYEAQARVAVGPTPVGPIASGAVRQPVLEREREVLTSNEVTALVADRLDTDRSPGELVRDLSVSFVPDSEVMRITFTSVDPEEASEVANAFAEVYVTRRDAAVNQAYTQQLSILEQRVSQGEDDVGEIRADIDEVAAARAAAVAAGDAPGALAQVESLDAQLTTLRTDLTLAATALADARRAVETVQLEVNARPPTAEVLRTAPVPTSPTGPGAMVFVLAGLVVGATIGVVGALVRDRLDTTARDESTVSSALGANVLTNVPTLPFGSRSGPSALVMLTAGRSTRTHQAREAYRRLRSALTFLDSTSERPSGAFTVAVTSAVPGEGKSVTAANLAVALAHSGSHVALVNADLREPSLEALFEVTDAAEDGLSTYLAGSHDLATVAPHQVENLWLVPAGPKPENPAELLGSEAFAILLKSLREEMDYVIIDCPPVLATADPSVVARQTDGVVVVVDSRDTDTAELLQVRADLERSGATIIGAVLNRDRRRATRRRMRGGVYRTRYTSAAPSRSLPRQSGQGGR
jgi:capsular exopolysaccharide synthesis family protein